MQKYSFDDEHIGEHDGSKITRRLIRRPAGMSREAWYNLCVEVLRVFNVEVKPDVVSGADSRVPADTGSKPVRVVKLLDWRMKEGKWHGVCGDKTYRVVSFGWNVAQPYEYGDCIFETEQEAFDAAQKDHDLYIMRCII